MLRPFLRTIPAPYYTVGKIYWVDTESECQYVQGRQTVLDDEGDTRTFFEVDYRPLLLRDAFVMALQAKGVSAQVANLAAQRVGPLLLPRVAGPDIASAGLWRTFVWGETPEKHTFWSVITSKVEGAA